MTWARMFGIHAVGVVVQGMCVLCLALNPASAEGVASLPYVPLTQGHIGRYEWAAELEAPEDSGERARGAICLSLVMFEPTSAHTAEGNEVAQCGVLQPTAPMIEAFRGGKRGKPRTVLGMVFAGQAVKLKLKLRGMPRRTVRLRAVRGRELGAISSQPLTFFAHGYKDVVCLQGAVAFDASGGVVARVGKQHCY